MGPGYRSRLLLWCVIAGITLAQACSYAAYAVRGEPSYDELIGSLDREGEHGLEIDLTLIPVRRGHRRIPLPDAWLPPEGRAAPRVRVFIDGQAVPFYAEGIPVTAPATGSWVYYREPTTRSLRVVCEQSLPCRRASVFRDAGVPWVWILGRRIAHWPGLLLLSGLVALLVLPLARKRVAHQMVAVNLPVLLLAVVAMSMIHYRWWSRLWFESPVAGIVTGLTILVGAVPLVLRIWLGDRLDPVRSAATLIRQLRTPGSLERSRARDSWLPVLALLILGSYTCVHLRQQLSRLASASLEPDAITYRAIVEQMRYLYDTSVREPLWIWLISMAQHLYGDEPQAIRLLGASLFMGSAVMLFVLGLTLSRSTLVAAVAMALFSSNEYLTQLAARGLRDNYVVFAGVGLALALFAPRGRWPEWLRVGGATFFTASVAGVSMSLLVPATMISLMGFWRNGIRLRMIAIPLLVTVVLVGPYLYVSFMKTGDPFHAVNIHAVWYRNYEFVDRKKTGCEGCPTAATYYGRGPGEGPYSGEPVTSLRYIFGMHSAGEVVGQTAGGFFTVFLKHGRQFKLLLGRSSVWWYAIYLLGVTVLMMRPERVVMLVPLMFLNLTLFLIHIGDEPRLLSVAAPFLCLSAAYGLKAIVRGLGVAMVHCSGAGGGT